MNLPNAGCRRSPACRGNSCCQRRAVLGESCRWPQLSPGEYCSPCRGADSGQAVPVLRIARTVDEPDEPVEVRTAHEEIKLVVPQVDEAASSAKIPESAEAEMPTMDSSQAQEAAHEPLFRSRREAGFVRELDRKSVV